MNEDKPHFCPFCGNVPKDFRRDCHNEFIRVKCVCGAQGPDALSDVHAIRNWNGRIKFDDQSGD